MSILGWIIFGGIAGWIGTRITGTNAKYGIIANIIFGIIGAIVGGFIGNAIGLGDADSFSIGSLIIAIGGATLTIWVVNKFSHA